MDRFYPFVVELFFFFFTVAKRKSQELCLISYSLAFSRPSPLGSMEWKKKNPCTVYQEGPIKSAVMDPVSLGNGLGKKGQEDLPKR